MAHDILLLLIFLSVYWKVLLLLVASSSLVVGVNFKKRFVFENGFQSVVSLKE